MSKTIKIHPIIKKLQEVEQEALIGHYYFAMKPINEAIDKIGWNLAGIHKHFPKEGNCKGWS